MNCQISPNKGAPLQAVIILYFLHHLNMEWKFGTSKIDLPKLTLPLQVVLYWPF